jgi:hypothetical protein
LIRNIFIVFYLLTASSKQIHIVMCMKTVNKWKFCFLFLNTIYYYRVFCIKEKRKMFIFLACGEFIHMKNWWSLGWGWNIRTDSSEHEGRASSATAHLYITCINLATYFYSKSNPNPKTYRPQTYYRLLFWNLIIKK